MGVSIHATAMVAPGAELGAEVEIGPYAVIGAQVQLGDGCSVGHHATVDGNTHLGPACVVHPYAYVGGRTQDLKYAGGDPPLRIGARNTFREFCTVHGATTEDGATTLGDDNYLLAYTHVGHDCSLGSHIIMSNNAALSGHVVIGDHAVLMGYATVHQFCRIGAFAMIAGFSKLTQDLPPFLMADGNPAEVRTVHTVKLQRMGHGDEAVSTAKRLYRTLYREKRTRADAVAQIEAMPGGWMRDAMLAFLAASTRGLA